MQESVQRSPKLKVKIETIRTVDINDLEEWLSETFNIPRAYISLQADNEWGNDGIYRVYAEDHSDSERGLKYEIDLWGTSKDTYNNIQRLLAGGEVDGRDMPRASSLLDYAASAGWIDEGEYVVEIW